jgi:hypothetical protein
VFTNYTVQTILAACRSSAWVWVVPLSLTLILLGLVIGGMMWLRQNLANETHDR